MHEKLRIARKRLYVHTVITGGQALFDTLNGFSQLAEVMRLWFLYALLGGRSARRGLAFIFAALACFFYCFVHEAFVSQRRQNIVPIRYDPKPIKLGLPPSNWKSNRR